jgi:hypothetical protein
MLLHDIGKPPQSPFSKGEDYFSSLLKREVGRDLFILFKLSTVAKPIKTKDKNPCL